MARHEITGIVNNALILPYTALGSLLTDTRQEMFDQRLATSLGGLGLGLGYGDNAVLSKTSFAGQAQVSLPSLPPGSYTVSADYGNTLTIGWQTVSLLEASYAPATGATQNMWSTWPWVSSTLTGLRRCCSTSRATPSVASMPGSMTTHSEPGAVATT